MKNEKLLTKLADFMYAKWTSAVCMRDAYENYRIGNIEESWFDLFCWAESQHDQTDIFYSFSYAEYTKAITLLRGEA